jgi:MarR family transcriptional regulator for hemolysin
VVQYDFEQSIGYWLSIATQALHRQVSEALAPDGITFRQAQVLGWLALESELPQCELAAKMMIEPPTLVALLDRMEASGWISRHPCSEDRRRKLIGRLPASDPVWERITQSLREVRSRATAGMTEQQAETLRELLSVVHANLTSEKPVATTGV